MSNQGKTPKSGLILLCLAFIGVGIYRGALGLAARRTGELIHGLWATYASDKVFDPGMKKLK